jgi:NADH:ubiquinone oxidoreductase subunit F (NADH-binding)
VTTPDATDVMPATALYRLLGPPADLQAHRATFGRAPFPSPPTPEWRAHFAALLEESGLSGRGGAGFPSAAKLARAQSGGGGGLVVANAMEGEPASDKDKVLLLRSPHLVLDGANLLALASGADEVVVCVPAGREQVAQAVHTALLERTAHGHRAVSERMVRPPDRFVAGEESALVGWLASGISLPSFRPDKSIPLRLGRRAALVHNVETLAQVALIAHGGTARFRSHGLPEEPGTTLVTISGAVQHPGVVEVDRGTPLADVVARSEPSRSPVALLVGGYAGTWVGPQHFATPYASLPLRTIGAAAGVGVLVALGPDACGIAETARLAHYLAGQSAGQCGPCVYGLPAIADDLTRLAVGRVDPELLTRLHRRLSEVDGRGACRHPDGAVAMVRSALAVFALDVSAHAGGKPCPHAARPSQLRFPAAA